jgi:hypothetical protein
MLYLPAYMFAGIVTSTSEPELTPELTASLSQITPTCHQPPPSSLGQSDAEANKRKAPWIDLVSTMKSRTCKFVLLAVLIISVVLVVLVALLVIKPWVKPTSNQPAMMRTPMTEGKSSAI